MTTDGEYKALLGRVEKIEKLMNSYQPIIGLTTFLLILCGMAALMAVVAFLEEPVASVWVTVKSSQGWQIAIFTAVTAVVCAFIARWKLN